jgi:iron complex transport system permease protein
MTKKKVQTIKTVLAFTLTPLFLLVFILLAVRIGGLKVSYAELFRGIFIEHNETVSIIVQLRFPRIFVAIFGGMLMAVAGVLLQAVLKNPLADPGIIGISSGSAFVAVLVAAFFPALAYLSPLFSFFGGLLAFVLVYSLSWKKGLNSVRLVLVGIAIDALFTGLSTAFTQLTGNTFSGAASIIEANISLKTWQDVIILACYTLVGGVMCIFSVKGCNELALSDRLAGSIGVNVNRTRFLISLVAVLLSSAATAIIGSVSFLGLIVPHIARLLVGNDHKKLIPYSAILGALFFLAADTVGRWIAYPYEVSANILMSIVGGPLFIVLLMRSNRYAK